MSDQTVLILFELFGCLSQSQILVTSLYLIKTYLLLQLGGEYHDHQLHHWTPMGPRGPIWALTHTGLTGWPSVRSRCSGVAVRPCKLRPKRRPWSLQVVFSHKNWQRFPIVSECFLCWYHRYWSPKVGLKQTKVHTSWILKVACDNLEIGKK